MFGNNLHKNFAIYAGAIAVATLLTVVFWDMYGDMHRPSVIEPTTCLNGALCEPESVEAPVVYFEDVSLEAKAAIVWDVKRQEAIFAMSENTQLPLASLTKIMTALVASEMLPEGLVITIEDPYLQAESDDGLLPKERWRLSDLIDFTLIKSSNDGALALSAVAGALGQQENQQSESDDYLRSVKKFIGLMNSRATDLDLRQTYFINGTGLDFSDTMSGSYGSAYDMARLFEHVVSNSPELFDITRYPDATFTSASGFVHTVSNTNELVNDIPGFIAGKTGYTDIAGGNLAIAFDAGPAHPIVVVVLGSSIDGRFDDTEELVWATLRYLSERG